MQLHNTLTKQVESFTPIKPGQVSLYSCGPTVYDHVHIGNLRAFVFADVLRRTLKVAGLKVSAVMNITDVDDKTIHRALDEYPNDEPPQALQQLTQKYEQLFLNDCQAIGIDLSAVNLVRATEHIEDMSRLINQIHDQGFAYVADDGVYFNVAKYAQTNHYGVLSKVALAKSARERIDNDEYDKDDARDFALWKKSDPDEPSWEITIDGQVIKGRPGWHIECSAMSAKYLGTPFDIHSGGIDLTFPHHENEIAQTRAASGHDLARIFVHNEHLLVDGKKMSKSLGNFHTLADITAKHFDPLALRLLILQSHYRTQQNFTWGALEAAANALRSIRAWSDLRFQCFKSKELTALYRESVESFKNTLLSDLSTPSALSTLFNMIERVEDLGVDSLAITKAVKLVDEALGLQLMGRSDIPQVAKDLLLERDKARLKQDFQKADEIRAQLFDSGVEVQDSAQGSRWSRR